MYFFVSFENQLLKLLVHTSPSVNIHLSFARLLLQRRPAVDQTRGGVLPGICSQ